VKSSSLNRPCDFVFRRPEPSHQLGDRRELPLYLVAAGDFSHALASEAELVANGLKGQTTGPHLNHLLRPCHPLLGIHRAAAPKLGNLLVSCIAHIQS
jgi:hypothetical protein